MIRRTALVGVLLLCLPIAAGAQQDARGGTSRDSVTTTPEGRYEANGFHRFFLGDLNRDLWPAPIPAPILDLSRFGGGLTPLRKGGGLQTRSLRMRGGNGQVYNFRSIDKDATRSLDPLLRNALPARVMQDQIGALFPLSALIVAPLLEAADVLHPDPTLVVMPDDPALGEFREEFAGLLGWIEVRPDEGPDGEPGFAGSTRVIGSPRLLERLEESPEERVNAESYLRARLMDVFVGDWDRHPDQWRWAGFEVGNSMVWEPIPRDRDWALARLDGVLVYAAGRYFSHYRGFDTDYEPAFNATFTGRALDRRILQHLTRADFLRTAEALQRAIDDQVLEEAVGRLPPSYERERGDWLREALTNRRDGLVRFAGEYYDLLAGWVDIYGSDEEDLALVEHLGGGQTRVRLFELRRNEPSDRPYFDRTFSDGETREIRLFLHGDDDRVEITGAVPSRIHVRAIGGGGDDEYRDESGGRSSFHDHRGDNEFESGPRTEIDEEDWEEPPDQFSATHQSKARDWGSWTLGYPLLSYNPDHGIYLGATIRRDTYGFRHFPYERRLVVTGALGPSVGRARATVHYDFPVAGRGVRGLLDASASSKEFTRFFGFGNDTELFGDDDFFRFTRDEVTVDLQVGTVQTDPFRFSVGPSFLFMDHDEIEGRLIGQLQPYGLDRFSQIGLKAKAALDRRDHPMTPRSGWIVEGQARVFPALMDVEEAFGGVAGQGRWYLSADGTLKPTLAFRVGGEKRWGTLPYHEAAYLGGPASALGLREQRFAGDATVYGGAMASVFLTRFFFLLPGELGLLALSEAGRVFLDGESPGGWHGSYGGGVWLSFVNPHTQVSLTVARSSERTGLYFGLGWPF